MKREILKEKYYTYRRANWFSDWFLLLCQASITAVVLVAYKEMMEKLTEPSMYFMAMVFFVYFIIKMLYWVRFPENLAYSEIYYDDDEGEE